jgi:hypothetical protein
MSQESVERFLGRALMDDGFRRMAMGSIRLAMAADNLAFTNEEMDAMTSIDWNVIELVSGEMNKTIKRSSAAQSLYQFAENDLIEAVALPSVGAIR